ncbi:DUF6266 family protein [Carboxylicivirga linearis]|uniref:Uncharacterized protein n=1 Tax=Carboxylicivirga linearis TaxID=1628157 RepID=A0ABS5JWE3_9BACT|nr:DUF6266 family protein [Carboxylicivirga linearis]MBS2099095.1 hypothetical protein [Carboxylicivirga linearis]
MGKYDKGILGAISGKVGTVVGSRWKGIRYLRSLAGPRKGVPSIAQLKQQARFALGVQFLQPIHPLIKVGYRTQIRKQSPYNAALSDLLTTIIEGEYPDYRINFERFRMSKGTMEPPLNPVVNYENNQLAFTWDNNSDTGDASADDQVLLLVLAENMWPVFDIHSFTRDNASGTINLPDVASGQQLFCFMAFVGSGDKKSVSKSTLVGTIIVP